MAKLSELLSDVAFACEGVLGDLEVKGIVCDSKKVTPGDIFIATSGTKADGHDYIWEAIDRGASVVVSERDFYLSKRITKIIVEDSRRAMIRLAKNFYGDPSKKIKVIGITGTNGKTTTAYLVESILNEAGEGVGAIGTISYRFKDREIPATNTTPGVLDLQSLLHQMVSHGLGYAVIEVSSHSLDQDRVAGIDFECAAFTNLTHDHLDYHKDLEDYFLAKSKLFEMLSPDRVAVINEDDPYGQRLLHNRKGNSIGYGLSENSDISCMVLELDGKDTRLILKAKGFKSELKTKLIGRHNLYNIMAATGVAFSLGIDFQKIIKGIESLERVPGRLQRVDSEKPFEVFVDYAHTDDALKNVISTLRELRPKRLLVLFGCGGDRDKLKRPKMGKAATELADYVVLTSDNPRSEDPDVIIRDIEKGITKSNYKKILDRKEAIYSLIGLAKEGDILLIAGKGHETYQVFKDKTVTFDDAQVARGALESLCLQ